jgi:hypothetical protein
LIGPPGERGDLLLEPAGLLIDGAFLLDKRAVRLSHLPLLIL